MTTEVPRRTCPGPTVGLRGAASRTGCWSRGFRSTSSRQRSGRLGVGGCCCHSCQTSCLHGVPGQEGAPGCPPKTRVGSSREQSAGQALPRGERQGSALGGEAGPARRTFQKLGLDGVPPGFPLGNRGPQATLRAGTLPSAVGRGPGMSPCQVQGGALRCPLGRHAAPWVPAPCPIFHAVTGAPGSPPASVPAFLSHQAELAVRPVTDGRGEGQAACSSVRRMTGTVCAATCARDPVGARAQFL